MTDKLHCPFCGAELTKIFCSCACGNSDCPHCATELPMWVWQALIDGKKAQDALKGMEIRVFGIRSCVQDGYTQLGERNRNIFIALELFKDLIKEITSITKQEK